MKNSSDYINEKVLKVNKNYSKLQNKTEELFFRCLEEGRSVEYFAKKLDEIWGNIDHSYFNEEIEEYTNIIHENNMELLKIQSSEEINPNKPNISPTLLLLIGLGVILATEEKFVNYIKNRYSDYYNSQEYKNNKEEYLKLKVSQYDNQIVPYFDKDGNIVRWVQLSTYVSMIHNTNLTRAGWNATLTDGFNLGYSMFWIPPHLFSCEHCAKYQGRILKANEVLDIANDVEEHEGDILHPNCKCSLLVYVPGTDLMTMDLTTGEIEYYYDIRQKVNSLTLKKERLLTDRRVQKELGNQDSIDKLNNQIKKINTQIRELIDELPTEEMKKKVVAINR